jgi:hypothetical protein
MTIRRMKTYTGEQGYVYQYYFVGKRSADDVSLGPSTEYIFDVTADRKTMFAVSVVLPKAALDSWARTHSRVLTEAEQYAAVKMRLFRAFDEIENMLADGRRLTVDSDLLQEVLGKLGVA